MPESKRHAYRVALAEDVDTSALCILLNTTTTKSLVPKKLGPMHPSKYKRQIAEELPDLVMAWFMNPYPMR